MTSTDGVTGSAGSVRPETEGPEEFVALSEATTLEQASATEAARGGGEGPDASIRKRRQSRQPVLDNVAGTEDEGEGAVGDERAAAAQKVIRSGRRRVNRRERPRLTSQLDGKNERTRSRHQKEAIDRGLDKVERDRKLDIETVSVKDGENTRILSSDGSQAEVRLAEGERSKVVETTSGKKVLAIDDDLSTDEAAEEAAGAVADVIVEAVVEEGGEVDSDFFYVFVDDVFKSFRETHYNQTLDYGTYLWRSLVIT